MSNTKPELTQLEVAQLLRDFIDARIKVFEARHMDVKQQKWAAKESQKLFNQIAGIE